MRKFWIKISLFILGLLVMLSPFGIFALVANNQIHAYSKTYYAALVDKTNYLKSIRNEKKIVLIGGSNVAFGFNSEILEQEFPEYKVANFGLYAMLGTKIMMELAIDYISKDDLVFIIPEINPQSTSLYFNAESALKALEDNMDLIKKLDKDDKSSIYKEYVGFIVNRGKYKKVIEPDGVYQRKNFNKYGDIEYIVDGESKRAKNKMALHFDPSMPVDYSYEVDKDFIYYLNNYSKKIISKGAKAYYTWCPVDDLSVNSDLEVIKNYYWRLRESIIPTIIGSPNEYIFDSHYFYDSNFHMNDAGATFRTYKFIEDYYRDELLEYKDYSTYYPELPDYESIDIDTSINSDNADDFIYNEVDGHLEIIGVNDDSNINPTLPSVAEHKVVVGIAEEAFMGSNIQTITIPTTIHYIKDRAFANSDVGKIYMVSKYPEDTQISWDGGLIEGAIDEFMIYVPKEALNKYKEDYFWGPYRNIISGYENNEEI